MRKNYIGLARDHSGSMASLARPAMVDYNDTIQGIREAAVTGDRDTIVSTVYCFDGLVRREYINSSIAVLKPLTSFQTAGQTPLFDSVGDLIDLLSATPDILDTQVSYLVMAITDGQENASRLWNADRLKRKIRDLQNTDQWTFVFRVPKGYAKDLQRFGIPEGNILEWETTAAGLKVATTRTTAAVQQYYSDLSTGKKSSQRFFTDLTHVTPQQVAAQLTDISKEVLIFPVPDKCVIRPFIESRLGSTYEIGSGFYLLSKPETIQHNKQIVIRNKQSRVCYGGAAARQTLGLPVGDSAKVVPGRHGDWDVYVQSTSVNRNLMPGTTVLYWRNART